MTLRFSPEILDALKEGAPVVALESTLVTHGFPHPENLAIARESEQAIRAGGAVPATIALVGGRPQIGLDEAQLAALAAPGAQVVKASVRDLAVCAARGQSAGTTVAATMRLAAQAGIALFATGGIGGVHRGVSESWDISADLTELSRSPVCVVSAGAKSLLDLPKTLEVLETLGVPVIGFGTDEFPAFYSRTSGIKLTARVDTPAEAAAVVAAHRALGLPGGLLIVQPIAENLALPADEMERHIAAAQDAASREGVSGKALTPFILRYIAAATQGRTIEPNKALIRANARLAAEIACALAAL
ncbi:MAG: pseudouridine-5'-phosphate glycosidase [Rhodospirillales bacterium]|nr:MAG: pseudouridine-5'-phosphate glycosidase [Rhodospirillales bacterium]